MSMKVIVVGDINGRVSDLFTRLSALHSKQNFTFAVITGNLFAENNNGREDIEKLLNNEILIPLPTYFVIGSRALPQIVIERLEGGDGELCPNLTTFGRRGSIKTTEGFKIVSIGGSHSKDVAEPTGQFSAAYTDRDAEIAAKGLAGIDILVTSDWPQGITDGSRVQYPRPLPQATESIANLCTSLKPKYHFSTSDHFYEREPFFHNGPPPQAITRFISLAPYGNPEKEKSIYAFSLKPQDEPPQQLPQGSTASPFMLSRKRALESQDNNRDNLRFANGSRDTSYERGRNRKRQKHQPPPDPSECYFCLSNKNCETHMIGSIGTEAYLTTCKGPLNLPDPDLGFPGHILLIPLQHIPSISAIADAAVRQATIKEMQQYREALQKMVAEKSREADGRSRLGAVTWEISRSSGVHLHWQFLAIPARLVHEGKVEAAFDVEAENQRYPPFAKDLHDMERTEQGDFMKVMIWTEALRKEMVLPLDSSFRFDLQFGRRVLAKLLGLERREQWRDCAQTRIEEEADVQAFKEAFKAFDFSLQD